MYEASERVPLIVAGPGVRVNHTVTELASLLDVLPTLMAVASENTSAPPDPAARRHWRCSDS